MAGPDSYSTLVSRWQSGKHVGPAKPEITVLVRKVRMRRRYRNLPNDEVFCYIPGTGSPNRVYTGYLEVHSNFKELPNVKEVGIEQGFDQNGIATATISMDNIFMVEHEGVGGLFHAIERGWFSPFRGYNPPFSGPTANSRNEWYEVVREKSTQVVILAGYGNAKVPIFSGLTSDTDLVSRPDEIKMTVRDFGQLLTDQRAFAWAKHPEVIDPITFADRRKAEDVEEVGSGANASGQALGNAPRLALDDSKSTAWYSAGSDHASAQPWISIKVPKGLYDGFVLDPAYPRMKCFVSIYRHNAGEWIDEGQGYTDEGVPYIKEIPQVKQGSNVYGFGQQYSLGDNSTIRLTFTTLHQAKDGKKDVYRAGVTEFKARKETANKVAKKANYILVDDASDVVRTVLQWMGLREWEVESTGVRLTDKLVFSRQTTFMEIITKIAELTNFVFFMKPPESFDESDPDSNVDNSLGRAVFRSNQAMPDNAYDSPPYIIRDDQILTGIDAKFSDEPLAQHIRVRGKVSKKGKALDGDRTQRYQYGYLPPWAREDSIGNGGVKKVVVHYDNFLESINECKVACLFIAFRQAIESATAQIQAPCNPLIFLDQQVKLYDRGTGLSTRLWVASRQQTFKTGENGSWQMTVGGSLIDYPDVVAIRKDLRDVLQNSGINPYPLPATFVGQGGGRLSDMSSGVSTG